MSNFRRNLLVGITVLVGLGFLGWMILKFGEVPIRMFAKPQMTVIFEASTGEGLSAGSIVSYRGVIVGQVVDVRLAPNQRHIEITANIDTNPPLPANIEGEIRAPLFGGGASLNLVLVPPDGQGVAQATLPGVPEAEFPAMGRLKGGDHVKARYVGFDLSADLKQTSQELRAIGEEFRKHQVIGRLAETLVLVQDDVRKAGKVLDSVEQLVSDETLRDNLRQTLQNFQVASASAVKAAENLERLSANANDRMDQLAGNGNRLLETTQAEVEQVSRKLGDRLTQMARVMDNLDAATRKLNEGKGSAAQLLNNPALYENLLDTSSELKLSIATLRRLVEQWEQEGVTVRLNRK